MLLRWLWCPLGNCCCKASPWYSEEESPCKLCHLQQKLPWMEEETPTLLLSSSLCTQLAETHFPSVGSCGLKGLLQQAGGLARLLWNWVDIGEFFYQLCCGYKSDSDDGFLSRYSLSIHLYIFFSSLQMWSFLREINFSKWHDEICDLLHFSQADEAICVMMHTLPPLPLDSLCAHFCQ